MIYAYSTLLNENQSLRKRLLELEKEYELSETEEDKEDLYDSIEYVKSYIKDVKEAVKLIEPHTFI